MKYLVSVAFVLFAGTAHACVTCDNLVSERVVVLRSVFVDVSPTFVAPQEIIVAPQVILPDLLLESAFTEVRQRAVIRQRVVRGGFRRQRTSLRAIGRLATPRRGFRQGLRSRTVIRSCR